jgi:hypothetical protein
MGSERLSHLFAIQDPTYKKNSSSDEKPSSNHSLFHTSGTQPVSISNGPTSSPSSKSKQKTNSKYKKLIKLYSRQLSHITTTLNAIESLSKSENNHHQTQMLASNRKRVENLSENLENFRNSPSKQDHLHFDPLKADIDQLMNDLKSYKIDNANPDSTNTIDYLVGFPLDASDSEEQT